MIFISLASNINYIKSSFSVGCSPQDTHDDWTTTFEVVKVVCSHDVICLIFELEQWLSSQ